MKRIGGYCGLNPLEGPLLSPPFLKEGSSGSQRSSLGLLDRVRSGQLNLKGKRDEKKLYSNRVWISEDKADATYCQQLEAGDKQGNQLLSQVKVKK